VRYIPDILTGTGAAASFRTKAEFGYPYRLVLNIPKILDKGNFSNGKSRIYPIVQTIRSPRDLRDNARTWVDVIVKMQFLELSYSNGKVEIKRIGSLVLYEYETYFEADEDDFNDKDELNADILLMVNHLLYFSVKLIS